MATKITGVNEYGQRLARLERGIVDGVHDEMDRSAETIVRNVKNDLRQQGVSAPALIPVPPGFKDNPREPQSPRAKGSGATRKANSKHIPSKPGEAPNSDTGRLMDDYSSFWGEGFRTIFVGTAVRYARWLEFGTSKMRPRPHLIPRYREELPKFAARLNAVLRRHERAK